MNHLLNALRATDSRDASREATKRLAYGACSALMPYLLAALLLIAFG